MPLPQHAGESLVQPSSLQSHLLLQVLVGAGAVDVFVAGALKLSIALPETSIGVAVLGAVLVAEIRSRLALERVAQESRAADFFIP